MIARERIRTKRSKKKRQGDELLIWLRDRSERVLALQWRDGAGELHLTQLTAAQSWPYMKGQE